VRRPRFPIAGLMAAVAAVAVNLAVMRSFDDSEADPLPHLFFACGVIPMASVLIVLALFSAPNVARGGRLSPYVFGFEGLGWVAVGAFIAFYSIARSTLLATTESTGARISALFEGLPSWVQSSLALGIATVWCSLPQLTVAMFGGWLARRLGITVRFELGGMEPAVSGTVAARDPGSPHVTYRGIS
jgi:cobalamin synthase